MRNCDTKGEKTMKPRIFAAFPLIAFLGLAAASEGTTQEPPAKSKYAGEYIGPFIFTAAKPPFKDSVGVYTISISADGKIKGQTISAVTGATADVAGTVSNDG